MKAQTALEYLMTYGWALLLIIVVVAVLYSLGVFHHFLGLEFEEFEKPKTWNESWECTEWNQGCGRIEYCDDRKNPDLTIEECRETVAWCIQKTCTKQQLVRRLA